MKQIESIVEYANKYDSFYVYNRSQIIEAIQRLYRNMPDVEFLYSVKCNSYKGVLETVFSQGMGADAASLNEVKMAISQGVKKEHIYYSAPGKSYHDIKDALPLCNLIADSINEIGRISQAAKEIGMEYPVKIGIRINPNFSFSGNGGKASKFGIDEDDVYDLLKENLYDNIQINGIHLHLKSQELEAGKLLAYYNKIFGLVEELEHSGGLSLEYINMGSGFGVTYVSEDQELDLTWLGSEVEATIARLHLTHPNTKVMIETGRYVVCQAGTYVTHVVDIKRSHGKNYAILQNTLNGFLRLSIAMMVTKYSEKTNPEPTEPLFTEKYASAIQVLNPDENKKWEKITLVGNLCTAADVVAEKILLPHLSCGDIITFTNAGSYAAVLSPMQFSSLGEIPEIMID